MRTATSRRSIAAKITVVPLLALALAALTACESDKDLPSKGTPSAGAGASHEPGTGDQTGKADPDAKGTGKPGSSGKPTGKSGPTGKSDAKPASADKLAETLLNAQEAPAGYTAGDVDTDPPSSQESKAADARCQILVDGSMDKGGVGKAERDFEKSDDPAQNAVVGAELVTVGLTSLPEADLKKRFDAYVAALRACPAFEATEGTATYSYRLSGVQTGKFGPNSVAFGVEVTTEEGVSSYGYAITAYRGTTGISVGAFSGTEMPTAPEVFARGQIKKVEEVGN